jgi:hypothetical protein
MCHSHCQSSNNFEFSAFCTSVRRWLADLPQLDPPLAAAVDLLDRRKPAASSTWFECEVEHVARSTEDMHAALGAVVVLSLWNAARIGKLTLGADVREF